MGSFLGEGLMQGAMGLSLVFLLRRDFWRTLTPRERKLVFFVVALGVWQMVSPLFPSAYKWPRSGRYTQFLNTFALLGAWSVARVQGPWRPLWGILGIGWSLNFAVGLFQHFVPWNDAWLPFRVSHSARVREVFSVDGMQRYGAGGLLFHRLRLAHGALAFLGEAVFRAFASATQAARIRWLILALQLGLAGYIAFARAATLTAVLVTLCAVLMFLSGRTRWMALTLLTLASVVLLSQPLFRARLEAGARNLLEGERRQAMTAGWVLIQNHPLLGVGFGRHASAALTEAAQTTEITEYLANDSHNLWLTTWAETGVVGVLLLLGFHYCLGSLLWRKPGAFLAFLAFHMLSLVHYLPYHSGVHLSFVLVWGVGLADRPPPLEAEQVSS